MKIFSVSELTYAIKSLIEPPFRSLFIRGEISNFKSQTSGHLYFSLKDSTSQISCALFKANASSLSRLPKDGDQVQLQGEISLYMPRGQYQLVVRELQFLGQGELLLKLQKLKEELHNRGWFDANLKKPLPKYPKKIGVVTSPTGAVIQDIIHVLTRRFANMHILLNPVKVQGPGAAEEIAKAIHDFNQFQLADVLIIGRGGGSIEDLWAFNEEIVAKAIHESKIPIISAVGHETDVTIADFVADKRAPTPSAAAEMAIQEKSNILKFLSQTKTILHSHLQNRIDQAKKRLNTLQKHPLLSSPYAFLAEFQQSLDYLRSDLYDIAKQSLSQKKLKITSIQQKLQILSPSARLSTLKNQLTPYPQKLKTAALSLIRQKKERLKSLSEHLRSLNPENVLQKGYTLVFTKENTLVSEAKSVKPNTDLVILFHDGKIETKAL